MMKLKIVVGSLLLMAQLTLMGQERAQSFEQEEYCFVKLSGKAFSEKMWAEVDYGEGEKPLADSTGNTRFNSRAHVLNYLAKQGWSLVTNYKNYKTDSDDSYLIFKRRTKSTEKPLQENDR